MNEADRLVLVWMQTLENSMGVRLNEPNFRRVLEKKIPGVKMGSPGNSSVVPYSFPGNSSVAPPAIPPPFAFFDWTERTWWVGGVLHTSGCQHPQEPSAGTNLHT